MKSLHSSSRLLFILLIAAILSAAVLLVGIWFVKNTSLLSVEVDAITSHDASLSVYYAEEQDVYSEDKKSESFFPSQKNFSTTIITIPDQRIYQSIRIDIDNPLAASVVTFREIRIKNLFSTITIKGNAILKYFKLNDNLRFIKSDDLNGLKVRVIDGDPFMTLNTRLDKLENGKLNRYYTRKTGTIIVVLLSIFIFFLTVNRFFRSRLTETRKVAEIYLTVLVLILIGVPSLFMFSLPESNISRTENRKLNAYPDSSVSLLNFPKTFTAWFNDHLAWRENLIGLNRTFHKNVYGEALKTDEVLEGIKDGWLYYKGGNVFNEGYLNKLPFSPEEINYIGDRINEQNDLLKKMNCDFYLMVVPNKETIYPENLPDSYVPEKNPNRTDQIINYLRSKYPAINVLDSRSILREAKKKRPVYFKGDTHWNMIGAIYSYHELGNMISKKYPGFVYMDPEKTQFISIANPVGGDLDKMLHGKYTRPREDFLPVLGSEYQVQVKTVDVFYPEDTLCKSKSLIKINPNKKSIHKILVFRDSYSNFFINYLAQQADTTIVLWTHQFTPEIIEKEKPDIVIHEILERFIPEFLEQVPLSGSRIPFSARKGVKEIRE